MSTIRVDMAFSHHSFSVASKRGHEIKKCSIRATDMTCFAAKHLKFDSRYTKLTHQR